MNKIPRTILLFGLTYLIAITVVALNICNKCGHENDENSALCSHCGANLPVKQSVVPVDDEPDDQGGIYIDPAIVRSEMDAGNEQYGKGKHELARLFYRNAFALAALADPSAGGAKPDKILEYISRSEHASRIIQRKCHRCDGTGKGGVRFEGLSGSQGAGKLGSVTRIPQAAGKTCQRCGGSGVVNVTRTVAEMKYQAGQAVSRYRDMQMARKYIPLGGVWIPSDMEGTLDVRQKASLMRAVPSPCEYCAGFGKTDCAKCKGDGRLPCPNRECDKGRVALEGSSQRIITLNSKDYKPCGVCNGRGTIECSSCQGDCFILCSRCNGTGEKPVCAKCSGSGHVECRRCKGTGEYKGTVCADCRGAGVSLCSSCNGEGRKK